MIKKIFFATLIVGLVSAFIVQRNAYRTLQAKADEISGTLLTVQAELGKVRQDNEVLQGRMKAAEDRIVRMEMVASWYGPGFDGRVGADGSVYRQTAYTCAHKTLPFGTVLIVEGRNGRRVPVVVTDRGPYIKGRDIDLSKATAERVGLIRKGVDQVTVYQFRL